MATEHATDKSAEHNLKLLNYRVNSHDEALREIRDAVKAIEKCLHTLSSVEERNIRTNLQLAELTKTVHTIEGEMPTMRLVRGWVIAGMLGVVGAMGIAIVGLVMGA